jgi:hypothetical protein
MGAPATCDRVRPPPVELCCPAKVWPEDLSFPTLNWGRSWPSRSELMAARSQRIRGVERSGDIGTYSRAWFALSWTEAERSTRAGFEKRRH